MPLFEKARRKPTLPTAGQDAPHPHSPGRIRVGVVDYHPLFRAGVIQTLATAGDFQVVGEGAGQADALRVAAEHGPDVLLLDLAEINIDLVRGLTTEFPSVRTIILTIVTDADQVAAALGAGAAGYMLKGVSGAELAESIRRVHRGERHVDPSLAARLLRAPLQQSAKPDRFSTLTSREEQVLDCLTRGLSNKEIARQLALSDKTVKHYITDMFEKLHVRNRVEAALLGKSRVRKDDGQWRAGPG